MMKNVSKEQADRIFRSCDTSGDNKISLDEFRTMLNKAPNAMGGGAHKDSKGKLLDAEQVVYCIYVYV